MPSGKYERKPWMKNAGHPDAVRRRAIELLASGKSQRRVAATLGVSRSTIAEWQRCACGGKLIVSRGPGNYVASCCERCTPVVRVDMSAVGAERIGNSAQ